MDDYGHQLADESLEELRKRYAQIYGQAAKEMHAKQRKFMEGYRKERAMRLASLDENDKEAVKRYKKWLEKQTMQGEWMGRMVDELSRKATEANELAMDALNDALPTVYAENANWAAYEVDRLAKVDTSFTLVDAQTIRNLLMTSDPSAYAGRLVNEVTFPKVNRPKDYRWNRQRFTAAVTQGILQGESIPNIVKRTDSIFGSAMAAAYRAARTATTSAECAGRVSSYERAESLGIEMKQEWLATLDGRTRDSHRKLDGQRVEVGKPFKSEFGDIRYPGDPQADPSDTWNCRCTLIAEVSGFETDDGKRYADFPAGMTYDQWKEGKHAKAAR
jgi:SPP1 gp7 family putative phage head morphogenesis protein